MITYNVHSSGFTVATLRTEAATAEVSLYGGHVLSYKPTGQSDVLFVSEKSLFEPGKPIRGGIPVCWPWFGPHATDAALPLHGFVRTMQWRLVSSEEKPEASRLTLECTSSPETAKIWPHDFRLTLSISVGQSLELTLITENTGMGAFRFTDAFHAYFGVSDIAKASIAGLSGTRYLDRIGEPTEREQNGNVVITGETNRIYAASGECAILDGKMGRSVSIRKENFPDIVVWNPWIERAKAMDDFVDDEYTAMLCVEAASTLKNEITVAPRSAVTQKMTIAPERA